MSWYLDMLPQLIIIQNAIGDMTLRICQRLGARDIVLEITSICIMITTTRDEFLEEKRKSRTTGIECWEWEDVMLLTTMKSN